MFQTQINETDVSRVKKLEDEIYHINSDLKKTERRYEVNMITISMKKIEDEIYHINSDLKKTERRYEVNMITISGNFYRTNFYLCLV